MQKCQGIQLITYRGNRKIQWSSFVLIKVKLLSWEKNKRSQVAARGQTLLQYQKKKMVAEKNNNNVVKRKEYTRPDFHPKQDRYTCNSMCAQKSTTTNQKPSTTQNMTTTLESKSTQNFKDVEEKKSQRPLKTRRDINLGST